MQQLDNFNQTLDSKVRGVRTIAAAVASHFSNSFFPAQYITHPLCLSWYHLIADRSNVEKVGDVNTSTVHTHSSLSSLFIQMCDEAGALCAVHALTFIEPLFLTDSIIN